MRILLLFIGIIVLLPSCKTTYQAEANLRDWVNIAVTEEEEIFTDTTTIRRDGAMMYASEKRIYTTQVSRDKYVDKIRKRYVKMNKPENAEKWNDFSYCIYSCLYDCVNKRFCVLSIEDYDSHGKLIIKTVTGKKNINWLNVNSGTIGDYTFFFVCDYENN